MQRVHANNGLDRRPLCIAVGMTNGDVVRCASNRVVDVDGRDDVPCPRLKETGQSSGRGSLRLRQVRQCEGIRCVADSDCSPGGIAKCRSPLPGNQEVVVVTRHAGPDAEAVPLIVENPFFIAIGAQCANHDFTLEGFDVDVRRSMHECCFHYGLSAALPLDRDRCVAVILQIRVHGREIRVANRNTIENFVEGIRYRVQEPIAAGRES